MTISGIAARPREEIVEQDAGERAHPGPPPVRRVDAAPDAGWARRFGPAYPFGTGTQAHRSRRCDGKIKIGAWIRFVFQCVMPPLAIV